MVSDIDTPQAADISVPEEPDRDIIAAYQPQEDVLNTPDIVGGVMSQNRLMEQKLQSQLEQDYGATGEAAQRKKEEVAEQFEEAIAQWRVNRGPDYVEAYKALRKTGTNIEAGNRVFESDWFRELQDTRAKQIEQLDEKERTIGLSQEEDNRREKIKQDKAGDERVSQKWSSLSDDYKKIKNRENTGGMTAKEIRQKQTELKQKMFTELDSASPQLRKKLLKEMEAQDPTVRREYQAHAEQQGMSAAKSFAVPVIPQSPALSSNLAQVSSSPALDDGMMSIEGPTASGKLEGGIVTAVDIKKDFTTASAGDAVKNEKAYSNQVTADVSPSRLYTNSPN